MTTQHFALEPNGPLRLQVAFSSPTQLYSVTLDGKPVGEATAAELNVGKELPLPDGSKLFLRSQALSAELEIARDGKPLPTPTNWPPLIKNAGMLLFGLGALEVLVGLSVVSGNTAMSDAPSWLVGTVGALGGGGGAVVLGLAYLACSYFSFERVGAAMWAAGALMLVDSALTVGAAIQTGSPFLGGLLARLVVVAAMVRGLQAVRGLKLAAPT